MGGIVIWIIILLIIIGVVVNNNKKKRRQGRGGHASGNAPRRPQGNASYGRPSQGRPGHAAPVGSLAQARPAGTAQKPAAQGGNAILERAKRNTDDVHSSHQNPESAREEQEWMARYGSADFNPGQQAESGGTAFGHGPLTEAVSGTATLTTDQQRENRLRRQLAQERNDFNSRSGKNAIMEAAKENALETQIDNAVESQRDIAKELSDLMIMGPDLTIPNERDFLGEAMEMLHGRGL